MSVRFLGMWECDSEALTCQFVLWMLGAIAQALTCQFVFGMWESDRFWDVGRAIAQALTCQFVFGM
ncbi:hypothetical protein VB711_13170 [Cronbergia sp. UHCC 0137]|uniref:hypothetical protein n=1 Tax=Cronbergia sp. UHCC 0137 TaxID=3110239 RepID=UPI002B2032FF|nr:hypothetical protein [Cronbergia sp. UHCC 0137]MEA5618782.1 hypothetical protein [Cronbergia sp. UHCC 0137]